MVRARELSELAQFGLTRAALAVMNLERSVGPRTTHGSPDLSTSRRRRRAITRLSALPLDCGVAGGLGTPPA
jgi:hypothetical protein